MTKEALKLALEAMGLAKHSHGVLLLSDPPQEAWKTYQVDAALSKAITAIKEALANEALEKMAENARELGLDYEPEQEPVAWRAWVSKFPQGTGSDWVYVTKPIMKDSIHNQPLYTTPPQRKPLTDEEIWEALGGIDCTRPMLIARAIEAKLKEKNVL